MVIGTLANGITPTPTLPKVRKRSLQLAEPYAPSCMADLGAGFGTMAFAFAKKFPQAHVVAYETAWVPWLFLHVRKMIQPRENLTIIRKDFFRESLEDFDFIYTYLYPKAMGRLAQKLGDHNDLVVISHSFAIGSWKPVAVEEYSSLFSFSILYLYEKGRD